MRALMIACVGFCVACDAEAPSVPQPTFDNEWTPSTPENKGPATLDPESSAGDGKIARRFSVDQLRRTIPALFGGETWTVEFGRNELEAFAVLARTLGEPDYVESTNINIEPSPLFSKFMDDMAGNVCRKAITRDLNAGENDELLVIAHPNDIDQNLRFLRLKLHGIYVPEGSMEGLGDLRQLYDDVLNDTGDSNIAHYTICVAMVTAPEFMAY